MTDSISFVIQGTPPTKARPRFTRTGRTYVDAKTRKAEASVLAAYLETSGERTPHAGPVSIIVDAAFAPPKSWPKTKNGLAISGLLPHLRKPDLDNIIKILDALNGVAWIDDSQVVRITATKRHAETPSLSVLIHFLPNPKGN